MYGPAEEQDAGGTDGVAGGHDLQAHALDGEGAQVLLFSGDEGDVQEGGVAAEVPVDEVPRGQGGGERAGSERDIAEAYLQLVEVVGLLEEVGDC